MLEADVVCGTPYSEKEIFPNSTKNTNNVKIVNKVLVLTAIHLRISIIVQLLWGGPAINSLVVV